MKLLPSLTPSNPSSFLNLAATNLSTNLTNFTNNNRLTTHYRQKKAQKQANHAMAVSMWDQYANYILKGEKKPDVIVNNRFETNPVVRREAINDIEVKVKKKKDKDSDDKEVKITYDVDKGYTVVPSDEDETPKRHRKKRTKHKQPLKLQSLQLPSIPTKPEPRNKLALVIPTAPIGSEGMYGTKGMLIQGIGKRGVYMNKEERERGNGFGLSDLMKGAGENVIGNGGVGRNKVTVETNELEKLPEPEPTKTSHFRDDAIVYTNELTHEGLLHNSNLKVERCMACGSKSKHLNKQTKRSKRDDGKNWIVISGSRFCHVCGNNKLVIKESIRALDERDRLIQINEINRMNELELLSLSQVKSSVEEVSNVVLPPLQSPRTLQHASQIKAERMQLRMNRLALEPLIENGRFVDADSANESTGVMDVNTTSAAWWQQKGRKENVFLHNENKRKVGMEFERTNFVKRIPFLK